MTKKVNPKPADESRRTSGFQSSEILWRVLKKLPTDSEPYGKRGRKGGLDCSCKCRWYYTLNGQLGQDWGVCANPGSSRAGLLTFEHQGSPQYETDPPSKISADKR
jgi:hypothetical protein